MKNFNALLVVVLLSAVLIIPSVALAAWWNPLAWDWNIFDWFIKPQTGIVHTNQIKINQPPLENTNQGTNQNQQQGQNSHNNASPSDNSSSAQNPNNAANTTSADYQLLVKIPQGEDVPTPQVEYIDDGVINSGTYAGYHRVALLQLISEMGTDINYDIFITKDYESFYYDSDFDANNTNDLSSFDQTKVVGQVSNVPLNHPMAITFGNFVLIRQSYYAADSFDALAVGADSTELTSNTQGLSFFANTDDSQPYRADLSSNSDYILGSTDIKVVDQFGLVFNYNLVSQESYARQQAHGTDYFENSFYQNTDFNPGVSSYNSYGPPLPGVCGEVNSSGDVLKNISTSDLVSIGTTLSGTQLYTFSDTNHPFNQAEYKAKITNVYEANYQGAADAAIQMNKGAPEPTYAQYVAQNPIIIVKDPWGRFVGLGEYQYQIPGGCGKPVIYLYPKIPTEVKVSLEKPMRFDVDIPTYKNGWDVLANPNGLLKDLQPQYTDCSKINISEPGSEYAADACKNNSYPYIYWAGQVDNVYPTADTGWVVAKNNLQIFVSQKLTEIGLNQKEISDMTSYWVPKLSEKNSPYYRISFFQTQAMNFFAPMDISPKPDTLIRVFLDWSPLADNHINIRPEQLTHINREGFTVVEWGGLKR